MATEQAQGRRRDRPAPDRHAGGSRGPPPVRRQPAEGDDRPLGGRRRPDDALLRPDARHRHRHQGPDLRAPARSWPSEGAAVLLYTSELKEIQLACDRAIVIFGGRVVAEIAVEDADEPTLLRAAYDLPPDVPMPEEVAATTSWPATCRPSCPASEPTVRLDGVGMSAVARAPDGRTDGPREARAAGHDATRGRSACIGLLASFIVITKLIQPSYGAAEPSRASPSGPCPSRWPLSPRPSSSSRAGSTSRSAR